MVYYIDYSVESARLNLPKLICLDLVVGPSKVESECTGLASSDRVYCVVAFVGGVPVADCAKPLESAEVEAVVCFNTEAAYGEAI